MSNPAIKQTKPYKDLTGASGRIVSLQGGTRSGKTYSIIKALIAFAYQHQDYNLKIEIVRKTMVSLRESAMSDFFDILHEEGYYREQYHNKSENVYMIFGNVFKFTGIDQAQKKRGAKRDILFINEANELTWDDFFQLNIRTKYKVILDYNPSMPEDHWVFTRVNIREDVEVFISTYKDNPYLTELEVNEIELLKETDAYYWQVFGMGLNAKNPARVFTFVSIQTVPEEARFLGYGLDFGFTNSPSCLLGVYEREIKDSSGKVKHRDIFLDEVFYARGLLASDMDIRLKEAGVSPSAQIYADSEDPRTIAEMRQYGWRVVKTKKPKDGIPWGIAYIRQHRLFITDRSVGVKKDFNLYKYKQDAGGEVLNETVKAYDHGPDAARYVILSTSYKGKYVVQ